MRKVLYIVLDGLGDLPLKELRNKTPLEAAFTPNLDKITQKGVSGIVYPIGREVIPNSDSALISILGYDVHKYYTGRGPLEAHARGLPIHQGDLALVFNFSSLDEDGKILIDHRIGLNLTEQEAAFITSEINRKIILSSAIFELKNTSGDEGRLVIYSQRSRLSGYITNTDPAYSRQGLFSIPKEGYDKIALEAKALDTHRQDSKAKEAAKLVNEFTKAAHKVLIQSEVNKQRQCEGKMMVNAILTRDAGDCLPDLPSINKTYGLKFGALVHTSLQKTITALAGMEVTSAP